MSPPVYPQNESVVTHIIGHNLKIYADWLSKRFTYQVNLVSIEPLLNEQQIHSKKCSLKKVRPLIFENLAKLIFCE